MTNEEIVMELITHRLEIAENTRGVNNFRAFQLEATKKIGFVYGFTRALAWASIIIVPAIMAVIAWALSNIIPAARIIVEEYDHLHPISQEMIPEQPLHKLPEINQSIPKITKHTK